ncbi:conserved Plasmodium protein, unknown function [Plasmodium berghei]|uniref:Uncharacterized protein n=2 Tax=Plasmodium berghei TaxID=5821 RepID=A0A509AHA9_PLABA|nr:conserved Plasmodium protein, unknown function [Plasmodium berghei ANKA]CXI31742.1 conserved Plasmodium protein, unknown function [Plasmodium berghei]SCM21037.1 conserved Plasmodium protein, unknown function [Plasmodium berghei]SCN24425.1 conserved Plasmodium protein, unknown function [Plasmodium berghei]SCO59616.1 conserved Plasmodium protein, unknown function [Plasmodium berghei]SCO60805.1 conserved Plasmodium protein, unknown function [Plasmodium berghei]|eukprot:XP_034421108.1 conserved Plasmodium protein, unknown function [Plasmodium berghei ANKA]
MINQSILVRTTQTYFYLNNVNKLFVFKNFGTVKIPESLKPFYEKKKEELELKKKKLEERKKKMDKVQISKERKNKFKSSKGQHNIY